MEQELLLSLLPEGLAPWEDLCLRAGKTRSELEQALLELQSHGIPVQVEEGGAGLVSGTPAPHLLLPRLRGKLGRPYRYVGTVPSTQDVLRGWAEAPVGAVVVAEWQSQGRGRRGRTWESPPGNLYVSVLLGADADGWLPLRAGVALSEVAGVGHLKWPNDLLAPDGRKLAGILVEWAGERVFLGVGLNVRVAPLPGTAALGEFRSVHRAQFLADFLWTLERWLGEEISEVRAAWKERSVMFGRTVVVQGISETVVGVAWDLGSQGELLVRTSRGMRPIFVGDVRSLRPTDEVENSKVGEGEAHSGSSGHSESEGAGSAAE